MWQRPQLRKAVWIAVLSAGVLAGSYAAWATNWRYDSSRTYRIGWEPDPPFQEVGPGTEPTGFSVELVREAARRRGIKLEWIRAHASSEASLRSGLVDLWPLMTITPERKNVVHISDPYLQHDHYLIVRADSRFWKPQDLEGATIAGMAMPLSLRMAKGLLPMMTYVGRPTELASMEEVCAGKVDAAFVEEFGGMSALLHGLSCSERTMRVIWLPSARTRLGVGSTLQYSPVADAIRDEISSMWRDNKLSVIMSYWGYYSPQTLESMNEMLNSGRVRRNLVITSAIFAALTLISLVFAIQIRRQSMRIRKAVAEREQAEKRVREWEQRFRDLLEGAQIVAIIIDLKKGVSFCNDYVLSITGWSREDMLGHPAEEFLDADYLRQLSAAINSPEPGRIPVSESAILTNDGARRTIQWTSTVLRDSSGVALGFASLGADVSELKRLRAVAATRESEERFRAIFQQAALGVAQIGLDGTVVLANDRYCDVIGLTREDLVGRDVQSYTHPDDFPLQLEQTGQLRRGEIGSFSMEKRYLGKEGRVTWARIHISLARDEENRPRYYISILEDITQRRQAEAALRESEERFRSMANTAPVMIWVAGTDRLCTFFNTSWLLFTGRTLEQELGYGWSEGVHPGDLNRCIATYTSAFDARRAFQMEYRLRSVDGTYRWVTDEGVPRFGPDGVFAGYIGCCVDITELKRSHEESLARQKLESLGVLAGGIAHDFNNLLGSILADSELVLTELEANTPARDGLRRINDVAWRAAEIVRELLAYAGKEAAVFEAVDLSALVQEMIEFLRVSISKRAVLELDLPANLPAVRANAAQIRQLVLNLVTNASEALADGSGTIAVSTALMHIAPNGGQDALEPGDYLRFVVRDTGTGMSEEVLGKIFDPFFTTKFAGRGLGLAAAQGIVRGHGGKIEVTSTPGQGTRFEIMLPSTGQAATRASLPLFTQTNGGANSGVVLVVEDEESLRTPVCKMLAMKGFSVMEAPDGLTAVKRFQAHQSSIDVVLLDMTLPGLSGREVYEELVKVRPDVIVVLTTAYSQDKALTDFGGRKSWAFLRKPYQLGELVSLLRTACRERQTAGQVRASEDDTRIQKV